MTRPYAEVIGDGAISYPKPVCDAHNLSGLPSVKVMVLYAKTVSCIVLT